VDEVELVGLRALHSFREDLEPSKTADVVDDFSHIGPFEPTQDCFKVNFKELQACHFIVVLLLFLV